MDKTLIEDIPTSRFQTLTDGVYTVALTLLVTTLGLPAGELSDAQFQMALEAQIPKIGVWLLSFWLILSNWLNFVRSSRFITKQNRLLLHIGALQTVFISLLPFSTSLIGEHWQHSMSVIIYTANLWVISAIAACRVTLIKRSQSPLSQDQNDPGLINLSRTSYILLLGTTTSLALSGILPGWNLVAFVIAKLWPATKSHNAIS